MFRAYKYYQPFRSSTLSHRVTPGASYDITLTTPPGPVSASTPPKVGAPYTTAAVCSAEPNMTGNPINFDVGFKKQTDTDYDAGGLTFSRIYRSDSTWTDNT